VGMANDEKIYYEHRLHRELIGLGWEHYLESGLTDKEGYLVLLKKERLFLTRHLFGLSRRDHREYFETVMPACQDVNVNFRKVIRIYQAAKSQAYASENRPSVGQHAVTDTHNKKGREEDMK